MDSKQIKITNLSSTDRISVLPRNIIECILDRLPIRDAVATSVISKEWRHKWTRIPNLVFDLEFTNHVLSSGPLRGLTVPFEFSNIIGNILLLHVGPIHKFVVYIPSFCNDLHLNIVSLMHFISRKEVKELSIQAHAEVKLPSYIFNCRELRCLKIVVPRLDLHPPQDFGGFCNLRCLDLLGSLDGTQISDLISKCSLLETLSISRVADGDTLIIDAPRLLSLSISCPLESFLKLKNIHGVTTISLNFGRPGKIKFCNLFDTFGSVPNVVNVTLWCVRAINDMPQGAPTSLPTTLHNHRRLTLLEIDISSSQCMHFILCIFKSSPNLQMLNLGIHPSAFIREEAAHFLDTQIREPQTLNSLLLVKIKGLLGSRVEIIFIKLILSCAPILETMYLTGNIVREAEFTLMSELLICKRPSPQAQVMYLRYPGDNSIFNF